PPLPDAVAVPTRFLSYKLAAAFGLAALADWLFYGQPSGISVVAFAIVLAACSLLTNLPAVNRPRMLAAAVVVTAGLIPAIEHLDTLSLLFVVLGLGLAATILTHPKLDSVAQGGRALRELLLIAPFRLIRDS